MTSDWSPRWTTRAPWPLAVIVLAAVIALAWYGYRATGEWQSSSAVLVERHQRDLGNLLATLKKPDEAASAYREGAAIADRMGALVQSARARLNESTALRRGGAATAARVRLDEAFDRLRRATPSRETAFLLVSVGIGYRELHASAPEPGGTLLLRSAHALDQAAARRHQPGRVVAERRQRPRR